MAKYIIALFVIIAILVPSLKKKKDSLIKKFNMTCKFNDEEEAKEEFAILGFVL
jgi:hypothetical protein